MATLAEQYMSYYGEMEKEAAHKERIMAGLKGVGETLKAGGARVQAGAAGAAGATHAAAGRVGNKAAVGTARVADAILGGGNAGGIPRGGAVGAVGKAVGKASEGMSNHPHATGYGAAGLAAGVGAAGAYTLKKLLSKKSVGERLVGAFKKNRGAVAAGAAGAAGLAGLAAFRKKDK